MSEQYQVQLNFLPILNVRTFSIYRKLREDSEKKMSNEVWAFALPVDRNANEKSSWKKYWVRFSPAPGYESFSADAQDNIYLTLRMLFHSLLESANKTLSPEQFQTPKDSFFQELHIYSTEYREGYDQLIIQPYYLKEIQKFGWLIDFHFKKRKGIDFSRIVQQRSLSLDRNFKRNLNYYLDRTNKMMILMGKHKTLLEDIAYPQSSEIIQTSHEPVELPAHRLRAKTYIFNKGRTAPNQFSGLNQFGPLEIPENVPRLLFMFKKDDRSAAKELAIALRSAKNPGKYGYPGFESLFKMPIDIERYPVVLDDYSRDSFKKALERVKFEQQSHPLTIPILVLPGENEEAYMSHKALFAHEGIPTQVCRTELISDKYTLKYSIANIALQIFCKSGGKPWKVQPTSEDTLIVGISQSHKEKRDGEKREIEKYFAFSVLSDNSGLFQKIDVLSESTNENDYLEKLSNSLQSILFTQSKKYSQVVIHTSFRLGRREMNNIEQAVKNSTTQSDTTNCRFAVVKVNPQHRFFGVNPSVNSLVPYEATSVSLGGGEYLLWFEGILPNNQTVMKNLPGPTHISFLHLPVENRIPDELLLQDLVNLSGANWRGFNSKSTPVSIFYCHLIADKVHDFHLADLPLPQDALNKPWFL